MARDKLITIRIEGEKRDLFNQLAKSQNTDTASLIYDFISRCLDGRIDVGIVTGKKQRIDKIDNQIDSERIDKLETTTQEIGERVGITSKKLNDWISAIDDRLTDCDRGLSEKITSLEHRLNALAIQLDSQKDSQEMTTQKIDSIDNRIDTDSQQDRQGENPDMGTVVTVESVDETAIDTVETAKESVEPVPTVESRPGAIETVTDSKPWHTIDELLDCHYPGWPETKEGLRKKALRENWPKRTQRGSKGNPYEYQAVLPE